MIIYLSHSAKQDYEASLYAPLKSSVLVHNHKIFFPHDKSAINSKSLVAQADLVLAEVSYPSTGQGIELGWANNSNTQILCFYKEGSNISGSLRFITKELLEYKDAQDMLEKLEAWFTAKS